MINRTISILLLLVGIINVMPLIGILSIEHINKLYALTITDSNLIILMQHRALLFGLLGGFIIFAAFNSTYQMAATILAFTSMAGFILIAWNTANYNSAINKIIIFDVIGLCLLGIVAILFILQKNLLQKHLA